MANREGFVANKKTDKNEAIVKYMNSLRTGDKIKIYQDDDDHYLGLDGDEYIETVVLFTTEDAVVCRSTWTNTREVVVFYKNGEEVDPPEDCIPTRIVFK